MIQSGKVDAANIHTINVFLYLFREPGKSKASFVLQKSRLFQRAIFFALLNPQPNGAGFAVVKTNLTLDLGEAGAQSEGFIVQCRAQVSWTGKISSKCILTNFSL